MKSTSSIGCVCAECNAPVDYNAGELTRLCTSGIDCFGAEDESSTGRLLLYKFGLPEMKLLPTPLHNAISLASEQRMLFHWFVHERVES